MPGDTMKRSIKERALILSGELGALIKEERERRGWSAKDLAEKMGMKQSGMSTWENGGAHFGGLGVHNIEALEDIFEMPRGAILRRLGVVKEHMDFATFVMSLPELNSRQKIALRYLHETWVVKEWTQ